MDRKLQRHRADSLRQHGFLVIPGQRNRAYPPSYISPCVCLYYRASAFMNETRDIDVAILSLRLPLSVTRSHAGIV